MNIGKSIWCDNMSKDLTDEQWLRFWILVAIVAIVLVLILIKTV